MLVREFAPFVLHRTYTGHHDEVLSVEWSKDSRCVLFSKWTTLEEAGTDGLVGRVIDALLRRAVI